MRARIVTRAFSGKGYRRALHCALHRSPRHEMRSVVIKRRGDELPVPFLLISAIKVIYIIVSCAGREEEEEEEEEHRENENWSEGGEQHRAKGQRNYLKWRETSSFRSGAQAEPSRRHVIYSAPLD